MCRHTCTLAIVVPVCFCRSHLLSHSIQWNAFFSWSIHLRKGQKNQIFWVFRIIFTSTANNIQKIDEIFFYLHLIKCLLHSSFPHNSSKCHQTDKPSIFVHFIFLKIYGNYGNFIKWFYEWNWSIFSGFHFIQILTIAVAMIIDSLIRRFYGVNRVFST